RQLAFGDEVDQGIPARPTQAAPADDDHLRAVAWERACQEWLEELRLNERSCREERGRLSELQTAVDNARRAEDRRDALLRDRDAARRLVEQLREQLDGMSEPAASDARLAELRAEAGQQSAAAADVELWASRLAAATRLQEQVLRLTELEERSRTAIDEAQARVDDWQRLRQARLDGFAAELAATLAEGEPCSVCGSTEHPAPATASDGVSEADETQAEQAAQVAMQARHTAELACSKLREEMAATRAAAGGSTASGISTAAREADLIAIAAQALAAAQARCGAIECAVAELARLEAERATLTAARERARQELHEAQLRLADREAAAAAATREAAEQLGTLVTVLRLEAAEVICAADLPDLAAARSQLDEECERLLTAGDALSALLDAARAAVLTLEAARAAADSASVDLAIAIDGAMSPEELDELEMEVSAYDEARAAVAATLSDEQLLAAASAPAPDVAAVEHRMAEAERVARQASAEAGAALVAARRCGELLTELVTHLGDSAPVRARHALVSELAFCLEGSGGGNALRMRLSAYVLAARLEAVAEVASQRLSHISGGRYALKHSDESSGRGRSGLGLKVVDGWTGAERDTSTLSGGETFFVSLALALALADVVTAEAGGVLLETLFVDEGFGSLDEETLDEVMATLDALRDGGRVVGVVSHVADMRQRIPAQLEVRKSRHGSSLVLHGV
ncbi:MAG: SbcC/MukB-like Walker B domain-containing protein, partial [Actinomycetales bacterium]